MSAPSPHDIADEKLKQLFPQLGGAAKTSEPTPTYNCIAHAAGERHRWWWPSSSQDNGSYWPDGVPRVATVDAFVEAYRLLGYAPCDSADYEDGFEKVAIYASPVGDVKHAARQLESGRWTSKLGRGQDIEHDYRSLESTTYGNVVQILRRAKPQPATPMETE